MRERLAEEERIRKERQTEAERIEREREAAEKRRSDAVAEVTRNLDTAMRSKQSDAINVALNEAIRIDLVSPLVQQAKDYLEKQKSIEDFGERIALEMRVLKTKVRAGVEMCDIEPLTTLAKDTSMVCIPYMLLSVLYNIV